MTERLDVTAENWLDPPFNRLGFIRVPELARTARISRGDGPVLELPRDERRIETLRFEFDFDGSGEWLSIGQMLASTYTDAFLVLHRGRVCFECYDEAMKSTDVHLLMSISKSLTSTLCGVFVDRGLVRLDAAVPDVVEELRGTAWEGCTVQHLLDMRTGTSWDYGADEEKICDVSGYRRHSRRDVPADTEAWIRSIGNSREHGGPFRYVSLANDVLGWVLERAGGGRFADLFSRELWSRIGAEHDAAILLDASGFSVTEGGICTTLRDLGRFGLLCLQRGELAGRRLVPESWFARRLARDRDLIDAYATAGEHDPAHPNAFYHDNWWIRDAERGIYSGLGINGQTLLIHHPSETVIVKLSSHPEFEDRRLFALQDAGMLALCESLAAATD